MLLLTTKKMLNAYSFALVPIVVPTLISALSDSSSSFEDTISTNALERTSLVKAVTALSCPSECTDGSKCDSAECATCEFVCGDWCNFTPATCGRSCKADSCENPGCKGCLFCIDFKEDLCPVTFSDVTRFKLPKNDTYWNQWKHSGRPYSHEGSPVFVDLNGDGILDFFNSMHGHNLDANGYDRMELGESVPWNFTGDGVYLSQEHSDPEGQRYRAASKRILINDVEVLGMDPHGQNVIDLDADGTLDIMISSGGAQGNGIADWENVHESRYNFLFWGEKGVDEVTRANVDIFRGGRDVAYAAGVHMLHGRGRINYMLDVNGDGLIDIFCFQDRRIDNILAPGVLLINQGNRTWREDRSMSEYTSSMMLTDADGDGLAQEIVLVRGLCFPMRKGPETDPDFPNFGPFSAEIIEFCSTRPVGTTAVFKYNSSTQKMDIISKLYSNISDQANKQPGCCQHGIFSVGHNCHATSMTSGDFDGDLLADQILLYRHRMVFYFSSDRPIGALPNEAEYIGAEILLPGSCNAQSLRVIDIDNDGIEEILIACESNESRFLLYTMGSSKSEWTLGSRCNQEGALGDLLDSSLASFTEEDIREFCGLDPKYWVKIKPICRKWSNKNKIQQPKVAGVSVVDFDNDGFLDLVVTHNFGNMLYFKNVPASNAKLNRFIVFKIISKRHPYGIGATLILESETDEKEKNHQFREISSYQHTTDNFGNNDDRIIFGLGTNRTPIELKVRWPTGQIEIYEVQQKWLKNKMHIFEIDHWTLSPTNYPSSFPSEIDDWTLSPTNYPSNFPSEIATDIPTQTSLESFKIVSTFSNPKSPMCLTTKALFNGVRITLHRCWKYMKQTWFIGEDGKFHLEKDKSFCLTSHWSRLFIKKCNDDAQNQQFIYNLFDGSIVSPNGRAITIESGKSEMSIVPRDITSNGQIWEITPALYGNVIPSTSEFQIVSKYSTDEMWCASPKVFLKSTWIKLERCHNGNLHKWKIDVDGKIRNIKMHDMCLELRDHNLLIVSKCTDGKIHQHWIYDAFKKQLYPANKHSRVMTVVSKNNTKTLKVLPRNSLLSEAPSIFELVVSK